MMTKQKIVLTILAASIIGLGIASTGAVYAQTPIPTPQNPLSELVEMIAQKFGLDKKQVQTVVTQYKDQKKSEMQKNMQDRENARLDQLIKDGKITTAQKQAIVDKLAALKKKYDPSNLKTMTQDERKKQFQAEQDEIKAWAQSQGIDVSYLRPGFRKGMGPMGRDRGRWMMDDR